jgi:hypothetical protein
LKSKVSQNFTKFTDPKKRNDFIIQQMQKQISSDINKNDELIAKNRKSIKKFTMLQKTKFKRNDDPYPWIEFPCEESALKRKFREAIVTNPNRYIYDIK